MSRSTDEALKQTRRRHRAEAEELTIGVYGRRDAASLRTVSGAHRAQARAQRWQQNADVARDDLARIESLPIERAAQFIETSQAQAMQAEDMQTPTARGARRGLPTEHGSQHTDPELGLGI